MGLSCAIRDHTLSPLSFQLVKIGSPVVLRKKVANRNEYRERIGSARDCFLVFSGQTKIGMIPISSTSAISGLPIRTKWRVASIDSSKGLIAIETL